MSSSTAVCKLAVRGNVHANFPLQSLWSCCEPSIYDKFSCTVLGLHKGSRSKSEMDKQEKVNRDDQQVCSLIMQRDQNCRMLMPPQTSGPPHFLPIIRNFAHVAAGRADYYGALPNLAARVSALAAPGQVLIEGSGGWSGDPDWGTSQDGGLVESKPSQAGWLPIARTHSKTPTDEEPIELEQQGYFLLKVGHQLVKSQRCLIDAAFY